jgi:hypothetical protein
VFFGSAAVLTVVALDVGLLGPRSTGMNLETASDELAGTAPRPVDAGPRFTRDGAPAATSTPRTEEPAEPRSR